MYVYVYFVLASLFILNVYLSFPVLDVTSWDVEQILTCNQPDMDECVACQNPDEEVDAMSEESPSGLYHLKYNVSFLVLCSLR